MSEARHTVESRLDWEKKSIPIGNAKNYTYISIAIKYTIISIKKKYAYIGIAKKFTYTKKNYADHRRIDEVWRRKDELNHIFFAR